MERILSSKTKLAGIGYDPLKFKQRFFTAAVFFGVVAAMLFCGSLAGAQSCTPTTWDSVNCRGCTAAGAWGQSCSDWGAYDSANLVTWCACQKKCTGTTTCSGGQASQSTVTVTAVQSGVTEKSIGANEGDSRFNINELIDSGIKNYRIYTAPNRFIWDSEGWTWGSVSIDQIKANPGIINWDKWDAAVRGCNDKGDCNWRKHGVSLYDMLTQLKANGIAPVIQMDNYWETSQWGAPIAGVGNAPPQTQADFNELWERTFASVYAINVRSHLGVDDWEPSNEPDLTFPGTAADYVKFSQVVRDAIKYVYDKYLPGETFRYWDPVTSNFSTSLGGGMMTNSISQNGGIISGVDWHNYSSTFSADAAKISGWLSQYGAGQKELYISEWGDYEGKSGNYNIFGNAMTYAKYLMQHSLVAGSHIDRSSIFSMYDWGNSCASGCMTGLISGTGVKTPSYYAFRLVTRGFQGAKAIYNFSGAPSDQNVLIGATKDSSNIYLTVLNNGSNSYSFNFDVSPLTSAGSYSLRLFSSSKNDEIVSSGNLSAGKLSFTSDPGTITQAVITSHIAASCQMPCSMSTSGHYTSLVCGVYEMTCSGNITCDGTKCTCDDASCPKSCTPKTCSSLNYKCGTASDGCNGTLSCGTCGTNQACSANVCVSTACIPKTCTALGYNCGKTGDSCGNILDCGNCSTNQSCIANVCQAGNCVPQTCVGLGFSCGKTGDGCGTTLDCGTCQTGQECVNNACQATSSIQTPTDDATTLAGLYAQIEYLQSEIVRVTNLIKAKKSSAAISCTSISGNLSYGMKNNAQVKCLQQFLKGQGFLSSSPTGNYLTLTKNAVAAFQSHYADELLVPYGLNHGSGNVDSATRTKINQIMQKGN